MNTGLGIVLIAAGSLLGLLVVFAMWDRWSAAVSQGLLVGCGVLAGAGALLVQGGASTADWAATLVALGVLTPLHARVVFGRPEAAR